MQPSLATYGGLLHDIGYSGGNVDENPTDDVSLMNGTSVPIAFGQAVARLAAAGQCQAPTADNMMPIGISIKYAIRPAAYQTDIAQYNQYDEVGVRRFGRIYVQAVENVTKGDQALSITAQNGLIGGVTSGAAGTGRVAIAGATWETTTAAGSVGVVRILNNA